MMKTRVCLLFSHVAVAIAGLMLGIYLLPILTASPPPSTLQVSAVEQQAKYQARFSKELKGSDFLHWGEGELFLGSQIAFKGRLAPGPDYKLYISPVFVEDEQSFLTHKADMRQIANITGFEGFVIDLPSDVDLDNYQSVIIWCETFSEFITAARYR